MLTLITLFFLLLLVFDVLKFNFEERMNPEEESPSAEKEPQIYTIGGVEIIFPHKAYPSQLSMMDKIIRSLVKKQNCLLESPTGSGKSLALLCAVLAWRRKAENDRISLTAELEAQVRNLSELTERTPLKTSNYENFSKPNLPKEVPSTPENRGMPNIDVNVFSHKSKAKYTVPKHPAFFDDDDDFKPMPRSRSSGTPSVSTPDVSHTFANPGNSSPFIDMSWKAAPCDQPSTLVSALKTRHEESMDSTDSTEKSSASKSPELLKEQVLPMKTPKIYFGTRTHKQISQIIRELKKTIYKDSKMTILSSRERTCINPRVLKSNNKQEECNDLIYDPNGPACSYYVNYRRRGVTHSNPSSLSEAWDLEDLIHHLKYSRACPYFSARALVSESEIVFCPYNYLVDPLIRASLDIVIKGNVIIMDEAHNLEDSAREAASWLVSQLQIGDAIEDIKYVTPTCADASPSYCAISNTLSAFHRWFLNSAPLVKQTSFDSSSKVYSGEEMIAILDSIGVGPDNHGIFKKHFETILREEGDTEAPDDRLKLSGSTLFFLKGLASTLSFIYRDGLRYMPDYRFILMQKSKYTGLARMGTKPNAELCVHFCCLNPAVAFSDVKDDIHTLVVASGTLSPMASFKSELGMPFQITLEANHVVSRSQMWVGTIGNGPAGSALSATYHNTETFAFQDEIGSLVLGICSIIPYGVLCFVSSYGMLDKLSSRWQMTGLWQRLEAKKVIVCESKGSSKSFDESIREFYDAVQKSTESCDRGGALLIAVCRGKVSEGLDFADNNARAVITIGIPFPSIKDTQVDLKRKYNDSHYSKKEIMSGSEWYEAQAFRALNQALGRCIRHRNDFGALIMVDERFQKQPRYVGSLSKWIRREVIHYRTASDAFNSLKEFSLRTGMCLADSVEEDVVVID